MSGVVRLPKVPMSNGVSCVSAITIWIEPGATCSSSATAWVSDVRMFWPTSALPVKTLTLPSSPMCSHAPMSCGAAWPRRRRRAGAAAGRLRLGGVEQVEHQDAAAQRLQEVAPVELEAVTRPLAQLVAFGLEIMSHLDHRCLVHRRASLMASGRDRERGDDARIGATAADIAVHVLDDLFGRGLGDLAQEADARHDHAAGAIAALHGARLEKRLLERMELAVFLEALDGRDLASGDRAEPGDARADRLAVGQHGAGPAPAFAAAVLGTGQAKVVAQHAEQKSALARRSPGPWRR